MERNTLSEEEILNLLQESSAATIIRCRPDRHIEFKDLPALAKKITLLLGETTNERQD